MGHPLPFPGCPEVWAHRHLWKRQDFLAYHLPHQRTLKSARKTQPSFQTMLTIPNLLSVFPDPPSRQSHGERLTCAGLIQPCGHAQRSPQAPLPLVLVLRGLFRTLSHRVTSLVLLEAGPPEGGIVWEVYPSPWELLCQPHAQGASLISVGALLPASVPPEPRGQLCCLARCAFILQGCLPSPLGSSARGCLLAHTPFLPGSCKKSFFFFFPLPLAWIPQYLWQLLWAGHRGSGGSRRSSSAQRYLRAGSSLSIDDSTQSNLTVSLLQAEAINAPHSWATRLYTVLRTLLGCSPAGKRLPAMWHAGLSLSWLIPPHKSQTSGKRASHQTCRTLLSREDVSRLRQYSINSVRWWES